MIQRGRGSLIRSAITVITVIATVIGFSLAAGEPMKTAGFTAFRTGGINGQTYYFFPDETGELFIFSRAGDSDDNSFRKDQHRFYSFPGINGAVNSVCVSRYNQNQKSGTANSKDTILLKLRI